MRRYQILRRDKIGDKWEFVAHGAAYDEPEARGVESRLQLRNVRVKLLPL